MRTSIILPDELKERMDAYNTRNPGRPLIVAKVCRAALEEILKADETRARIHASAKAKEQDREKANQSTR